MNPGEDFPIEMFTDSSSTPSSRLREQAHAAIRAPHLSAAPEATH